MVTSLDQVAIAIIAIVVVYFVAPDYLTIALILTLLLLALYFVGKYYIVYPVLKMGKGTAYEVAGKVGLAVTRITPSEGKMRIGGELWSARTQSGEIKEGSQVRVIDRDGIKLIVEQLSAEQQ